MSKHIAFYLEQAYGHITPTLGIAVELMNRGHRVSYSTNSSFAPLVEKLGATAKVIEPIDIREQAIAAVFTEKDCTNYKLTKSEMESYFSAAIKRSTEHALLQLERLYEFDRPDVMIHDDSSDMAGREFANKFGISKIRHHSQFIEPDSPLCPLESFAEDELILMTVPDFFQKTPLDARFRFVGFLPEGRERALGDWQQRTEGGSPILVSATTGLLPQTEFCQMLMETFRNTSLNVVLSISASSDVFSAIKPETLVDIPSNIHLNRTSSNFSILKHARLYVGQGGQGGTLEAAYFGVPQIIIPPTPYHRSVGVRVEELGLGKCLSPAEVSPSRLREIITRLLIDEEIRGRANIISERMRSQSAGPAAVDAIEPFLTPDI